MTMYENEDRRAAAVNAAAKIVGSNGYYSHNVPGGGTEYLPSRQLKDLSDHISEFIELGTWKGPNLGEDA